MHEVLASAEQVTHLAWIDIGHWEHSGDLVRVDLVVLGLSSVDRFHVQGMAEDEGDVPFITEVGDPVPGEDALDGDDNVIGKTLNQPVEVFAISFHVALKKNFAIAVEDAGKHLPCLGCVPQAKPRNAARIDADVEFVLFVIEPH